LSYGHSFARRRGMSSAKAFILLLILCLMLAGVIGVIFMDLFGGLTSIIERLSTVFH